MVLLFDERHEEGVPSIATTMIFCPGYREGFGCTTIWSKAPDSTAIVTCSRTSAERREWLACPPLESHMLIGLVSAVGLGLLTMRVVQVSEDSPSYVIRYERRGAGE